MQKIYPPHLIEKDCLQKWSQQGYLSSKGEETPYCIVLPPPNVTGSLHMGHGFQVSLMDALVRYQRMQGRRVLWQGGTDHAGIATQMVVERQLLAQGKRRDSFKREELLSLLSDWKEKSESRINAQLKRIGASIDFERNRFTLDAGFKTAVKKVLVQLHKEHLLYRGKRLVNWDAHLQTAISDLEVTHTEESGWLYYIRYFLVDQREYITVATTRPETLLGDVAIAVHPDDQRYQALIGQHVQVPLTNRTIPIIADTEIDPEFGTGCVKITPAHDFNDYKIGQRHQLPLINILTSKALLNTQAPEAYRGMDCATARLSIVKDLERTEQLAKKEAHTLQIPRGERSGVVIEPYLTDQWFIHMKPLAAKAIAAIEEGQVTFVPENWKTNCLQWLSQIEDWCISRQLWWGHRIPAWYTPEGKYFIGMDEASVRLEYGISKEIALRQDEDVLDTWVSAALWPFVTLGWPDATRDLRDFYPTDVLVTGFDIIPFWVARMLMLGLHFNGKVPFKKVYITGLIRDHEGQKMSKSKGNVLDPLDIVEGITLEALVEKRTRGLMQPQMAHSIEKFTRQQFPRGIDALGTDPLRMMYYSLASPTRDIRFDINRAIGYRNFCNKLWQVSRLVCSQYSSELYKTVQIEKVTHIFNQWILSKLQQTIIKTHQYFENYRFDHLVQLLYEFVWHDYCDWYVECIKPILKSECAQEREEARYTLTTVLKTVLTLLHPLMPFITEALWSEILKATACTSDSAFHQTPYPIVDSKYLNATAEERVDWLQAVVKKIRGVRSQLKILPHQSVWVAYETSVSRIQKRMETYQSTIEKLGKCHVVTQLNVDHTNDLDAHTITLKYDTLTLYITGKSTVNAVEEIQRLEKARNNLEETLFALKERLSREGFVEKAPVLVVEKSKKQLKETQTQLEEVLKQITLLSKLDKHE